MGLRVSFPEGPEEWPWPEAMATARCIGPWSVLLLRSLLAASYVGHACYDAITYYDSGFYFMYLTHISLFFQVLCSVFLVAATFLSLRKLQRRCDAAETLHATLGTAASAVEFRAAISDLKHRSEAASDAPVTACVALVLFCLQLPLSFMVVFMYWSLEVPIWSLRPGYKTTYDNLYVHGFQSIGMLITFLFSRIPFRVSHWGWLMLAGVLYNVWTYLQYTLRIGTLDGCADYPRDECPIYSVFDWHRGGSTLFLGAMLVVVACPTVMSIFGFLGWLRDRLDEDPKALTELEDTESEESETELS